jgi:hypothetical protein
MRPVLYAVLQCGQVTLEQVLPYLGPTDEIKADHDKARKQLEDDAASLLLAVLDAQGMRRITACKLSACHRRLVFFFQVHVMVWAGWAACLHHGTPPTEGQLDLSRL